MAHAGHLARCADGRLPVEAEAPTPAGMKDMAAFAASIKAAGLLTDGTLLHMLATVLPDFDVDAEIAATRGAGEREAAVAARGGEMQRIAMNAMQAAAIPAMTRQLATRDTPAGQTEAGQKGGAQ